MVESADGRLNINVGNHQLVDRETVHPMVANAAAGAFTEVQWIDTTNTTLTGAGTANNIGIAGTLTI